MEKTLLDVAQKADSIQKAMKKWSDVVNKSLLEIAKAVGIPLQYNNGMVGIQPSYGPGASMMFTTATEERVVT